MRSLLFVPGDSERKLEKGFAAGADVVIVDLEDSVSAANKAAARTVAAVSAPGVSTPDSEMTIAEPRKMRSSLMRGPSKTE